ncbi:hypothetical protein ACGF7W_37950 [Streptomyces sp. NPDC048219]|uniref:hypothetical protein n=1 Tax=Streptomyces sp. NPDC048219 TaxID=3365517 RepID=UPI0037144E0A
MSEEQFSKALDAEVPLFVPAGEVGVHRQSLWPAEAVMYGMGSPPHGGVHDSSTYPGRHGSAARHLLGGLGGEDRERVVSGDAAGHCRRPAVVDGA